MSTWPLPAAYIQTGNGPRDIPIRGDDSEIPGVPVIYRQTFTDALATMVRLNTPSGWTSPFSLLGGLDLTPPTINTIQINPLSQTLTGIVYGYPFSLGAAPINVTLSAAPSTGTRDDLVFLEAWFTRASGGGQTLMTRLRVADGVNFNSHPEGLDDPSIFAFGIQGSPTAYNFIKYPTQFDLSNDPGLYVALLPALSNDPLAEKGTDGNLYNWVFAIPVARIPRFNQNAFNVDTNLNGAPAYTVNTISVRPDSNFNDSFRSLTSIIDLHKNVKPILDNQTNARETLVQKLTHTLADTGEVSLAVSTLDSTGFLGVALDSANSNSIAVCANLMTYSHFQTDSDANGLANNWVSYVANSGVGTYSIVSNGQSLGRTDGDWGVKQDITNFYSDKFTLRLSFIPTFGDSGSNLAFVARRPDTSVAFSYTQSLTNLTVNQQTEILKSFSLSTYETALTIEVYLTGGNSQVILNYVDLKASNEFGPVLEVGSGTSVIINPSANMTTLGATFTTAVTAYSPVDGSAISGTATISTGILTFTLGVVPLRNDYTLVIPITYPAGGGFGSLISKFERSWNTTGFIGVIETGTNSRSITENDLAVPLAIVNSLNEPVTINNPETSSRGLYVTLEIQGTGTGTYTLPATMYGRNSLLPLAVRIDGSPTTLSSTIFNADGSIAITLSSSQVVSTGHLLAVDLLLDTPIFVSSLALNGIKGIYKTTYQEVVTTSTGTSVTIPLPGLGVSGINSDICTCVSINGTEVGLGTSLSVVTANLPYATITFASPVSSGSRVGVFVIVKQSITPTHQAFVAYETVTDPTVPLTGLSQVTLLTQPILMTHTKGTGALDTYSDYGTNPFIRDPLLVPTSMVLLGSNASGRSVLESPVRGNTLKGMPLYPGRVISIQDLQDSSLSINGEHLSGSMNHKVLVSALVNYKGTHLLMVLEQLRTDAIIAVDSSAIATFYYPKGRPVSVI